MHPHETREVELTTANTTPLIACLNDHVQCDRGPVTEVEFAAQPLADRDLRDAVMNVRAELITEALITAAFPGDELLDPLFIPSSPTLRNRPSRASEETTSPQVPHSQLSASSRPFSSSCGVGTDRSRAGNRVARLQFSAERS